jgi:LuxR family maltose regulon positive regulatory protein
VHISAANWLENHGFDVEAVEHYIEGKQIVDAVRLIEKNLHTLVQTKGVVLIRWVSVFPENSFAEKPMIELFYIAVLLGVGEWKAAFRRVEQAEIRFQALQEKLSDVEWNQAMGNIYFFCMMTSYLQQDLERTSDYLELLERHMPEGSIFQTMGCNTYTGYDSYDDLLVVINDLHAVDVFLLKWITAWENKQEYPFIGYFYASYSNLLCEWNRLDEAEFYINKALGRKDTLPFARILIQIAISASRIQHAKGNAYRASELLEQLKSQIDSPDYDLFLLKIEAEQACLSLQQGSLQDALDWLHRCGLMYTDVVSLNCAAEYLALARVLAACERMEEALYLLERLNRLLGKEDRLRERIKVLIVQSLTLQRSGQADAALVQLETALHLAEPQGYIRSFIDEGPMMAEMLSVYLKVQLGSRIRNGHSVSLVYVKQLLQALNSHMKEEQSVKAALTLQEMRIIKLIEKGLSNKQIAEQVYVTGETVKTHIKNIYRKLNANSKVQVLQQAKDQGLL